MRPSPCSDEAYPERIQASTNAEDQQLETTIVSCETPVLMTREIPESVALEWITSSSTHSLSDSSEEGDDDFEDNEEDDDLFGLEFVDSIEFHHEH